MIHVGDCIEVMRGMAADSVDAVVTDPPAGVHFMSKNWDHDKGGRTEWVAWMTEVMRECYRVLKPGGYAVVWSLPRTCHWTGWAMEDAGFYLTDQLAHVFASGFPKGRTQLKPAREDWWLARKPGPLRPLGIDECRIGYEQGEVDFDAVQRQHEPSAVYVGGAKPGDEVAMFKPAGRWPSNLLLSDPELFDEPNPYVVGSGATSDGGTQLVRHNKKPNIGTNGIYGLSGTVDSMGYGDTGGYSRFFTLPGRMDGCQYCGAPAAGSTSEEETIPAIPSDSTPESVRTNGSAGTGSPAPSVASESSDSITPTAPPNAQLWDDEASASRSEHRRTSEPGNESSRNAAPTTKATPRSKRPATSPRNASPSDPAMNAEAPVTSSATTTTTPARWTCDACAVLVTRASIPVGMSTGPEGYPEAPAERPDSPRYFIVPKSSRADREPVVRGQLVPDDGFQKNTSKRIRRSNPDTGEEEWFDFAPNKRENAHPTVKPVDLMRHLIRLVTPSGGTVLDPFLGSGSTAIACELEGFPWIGIEQSAEYVAIAEARLNGTQRGLGLDVGAPVRRDIGKQRGNKDEDGRPTLGSNRQDELIWKSYQPAQEPVA